MSMFTGIIVIVVAVILNITWVLITDYFGLCIYSESFDFNVWLVVMRVREMNSTLEFLGG